MQTLWQDVRYAIRMLTKNADGVTNVLPKSLHGLTPSPRNASLRWHAASARLLDLSCRRASGAIVSGNNLSTQGLRTQGSWCGQEAHGNAEVAALAADDIELRGIVRATAAGNPRGIARGELGDFR